MRTVLLFILLGMIPATTLAQSSQFGVRGLGLPGRGLATRAIGSSGAFALFDFESSVNPAALGAANNLTSLFTLAEGFLSQENPAGSASTRDVRFPQLMVVGPVRSVSAALGLSYSNYTNRDFSLASSDTIDLRGVPVGVHDSSSSRGGLNDLRVAGAYRLRDQWIFGAGLHVITGSNRLELRRSFDDSSYVSSLQRAEISYAGIGLSIGVIRHLGPRFSIGALVRSDANLKIDRDSIRVGTIDLPYTFGLGLRWQPVPKLELATQALARTWSAANSDLLEQGGNGAENTFEIAAGGEYTPDLRRPFRRPIRFGARYGQLPFPLVAGAQGHEFGISVGSGMRFAQQRGGIDLALEHVWRSEGVYSESGFLVSLGISVRP